MIFNQIMIKMKKSNMKKKIQRKMIKIVNQNHKIIIQKKRKIELLEIILQVILKYVNFESK